jgi:hypothetical protein
MQIIDPLGHMIQQQKLTRVSYVRDTVRKDACIFGYRSREHCTRVCDLEKPENLASHGCHSVDVLCGARLPVADELGAVLDCPADLDPSLGFVQVQDDQAKLQAHLPRSP